MEKQELDLTLMNIANKNSEMNKELYQNYVNKSKKASKQEIHGKTYVGIENEKLYIVLSAIISGAVSVGIMTGAIIDEKVSTYDRVLETKMEQELNKDQIAAYHNDQDRTNSISNWFDKNSDINTAKKELDSDDYALHGVRITDSDIEYLPFEAGSLLTEKDQDAIHLAADKVVEEYKGRAR